MLWSRDRLAQLLVVSQRSREVLKMRGKTIERTSVHLDLALSVSAIRQPFCGDGKAFDRLRSQCGGGIECLGSALEIFTKSGTSIL